MTFNALRLTALLTRSTLPLKFFHKYQLFYFAKQRLVRVRALCYVSIDMAESRHADSYSSTPNPDRHSIIQMEDAGAIWGKLQIPIALKQGCFS
jgi:hypothetical protein